MKTIHLLAALFAISIAQLSHAQTQTLSIVGTDYPVGEAPTYFEGSTDGGLSWGSVYSIGTHPWQFWGEQLAAGWVNVYPTPFEGVGEVNFIRIRFVMPDDFSNPSLSIKMKADNFATVSLNGEYLALFESIFMIDGDLSDAKIGTLIQPGLNEFILRIEGVDGWVAFQFLMELTFQGQEGAILGYTEPVAVDSDGDGVIDEEDVFPFDPSEAYDSDGDGVGDNGDAFPADASETSDSDGDGIGDNSDAFPNNASESVDSDGDGVGDNSDSNPNSDLSPVVEIAGMDTPVSNYVYDDGKTLSDIVNAAVEKTSANVKNHGQFVSAMTKKLKKMFRNDLITKKEMRQLKRAVAQSDVGKKKKNNKKKKNGDD